MRGRTNVLSGGGEVIVNGQVKEFEVAAGSNISVGDFVSFSREIEDPVAVEDYTDTITSRKIYIDANTYLIIIGEVKMLLIRNGNVVSSLISNCFVYLSTTKKVLAVDNSNNVSVYKIDDLTWKFVFQYTQQVNIYKQTMNCFDIGDKFISIYHTSTKDTVRLFEVTDTEITLLETLDLTKSFSFRGRGIGFFRNGILSVISTEVSSYHVYGSIAYFSLNGSNIVEGDVINISDVFSGFTSGSMISASIIDADNILIQFLYPTQNTYDELAQTLFIFATFNESDKIEITTSAIPAGYIGTSATSKDYPYKTSGKLISIIPLENDKFLGLTSVLLKNNSSLTSGGNEDDQQNRSLVLYCIYKIQDGTLIQLTEWEELVNVRVTKYDSSYWGIKKLRPDQSYFIEKDGGEYDIYLGMTRGHSSSNGENDYYIGQKMSINITIRNDEVSDCSNKVTSYNGGALGFAKTGGNAGDTIKVYVPYDNN